MYEMKILKARGGAGAVCSVVHEMIILGGFYLSAFLKIALTQG